VNLSLAINYALGGTRSSVTTFSIWRFTSSLELPSLASSAAHSLLPCLREQFGKNALSAAWAVAALWIAHPLHRVSHLRDPARRGIGGLCYLLTLYCFVRSTTAPKTGAFGRPRRWRRVCWAWAVRR